MSKERYELPEGWSWAKLGELAAISAGGPAPQGRDYFEDGKHLFVRVQDLGRLAGRALVDETHDLINDKAVQEWRLRLFPQGTVLFTKSGMSTLLNQRGILGRPAYVVSHIGCALPSVAVTSEWLYYTLRQVDLGALTQATTLPSLKLSRVAQVEVPLAPLPEQRRVVAKIGALFEQSRTARGALDRIPVLLKKFHQAVLAAAFRGDLTHDWREQNPDVEPASALLERIRMERRRKWVQDLHSAGRDPRRAKFEEGMPPETENLDPLPDGWAWSSIGQLFDVSTGGTPSRKKVAYWKGSIPWVSSGEVAFSRISDTRERITEEGVHNSNAKVHPPGTVLLAMIGEGKTRGQAAVLDIPASTNQNVAAILCGDTPVPSQYVFLWLRHRYEETRKVGEGGAQPALNAKKVRGLPIPVPPLEEQKRIIERVETLFVQADAIEAAVDAARRRADKLEQSILARAFHGALVPHDPNDEPASIALDRIPTEVTRWGSRRTASDRGRRKRDA